MAVLLNSPELRELSSTDLKFLEEGLDGGGLSFCDLDGILDVFKADTHVLLTNPDSLLQGMCHSLFTHFIHTSQAKCALAWPGLDNNTNVPNRNQPESLDKCIMPLSYQPKDFLSNAKPTHSVKECNDCLSHSLDSSRTFKPNSFGHACLLRANQTLSLFRISL